MSIFCCENSDLMHHTKSRADCWESVEKVWQRSEATMVISSYTLFLLYPFVSLQDPNNWAHCLMALLHGLESLEEHLHCVMGVDALRAVSSTCQEWIRQILIRHLHPEVTGCWAALGMHQNVKIFCGVPGNVQTRSRKTIIYI